MKKILLPAVIIFTLTVFIGCEREYYKPVVITKNILFATDIQPIFTSNCATAATCHQGGSPAKGLNLETGNAYDQIISKSLVDTVSAELSNLYVKINTGNMQSYSTPEFTAKVLLWIQQGAKNN